MKVRMFLQLMWGITRTILAVVIAARIVMRASVAAAQAPTAEPGFPSPGTRYTTEWRDDGGKADRVTVTVLEEGTYTGRPVYRAAQGSTVLIIDGETRNSTATFKEGNKIWEFTPHEGMYNLADLEAAPPTR